MTSDAAKPLVLIVDDTPTNIQVLAENLVADYRIKVATNGKKAIEIATGQDAPDLILLDVMMPGMDGYEVCRHLKQHPETSGIPVIFVTAMNEADDEERGLKLGAVDYITKPFHLPIVKARLHNHIKLKLMTKLLESMAWVDGLTGIPNRRRLDEALATEWKRAQRTQTPLALIMADIDHFKEYNDHYGHSTGDECLRTVASTLSSALTRAGDLVARYGGEEFALLMPKTDLAGARLLAEHICGRVEELHIPHDGSATSPWVTISVGYASTSPGAEAAAEALLDEADRMLYEAKNSGRNRVRG